MKNKLQKYIAKKIKKLSLKGAMETIGKSTTFGVYEIEIPKNLREELENINIGNTM